MSIKTKTGIIFTAIAAMAATTFSPAYAAPIPLDINYLLDGDGSGVTKSVQINIPVSNTTQSAYGGVVRYYDVAIAQATVVAYKMCPDRYAQGVDLSLTAGIHGQINMGMFYIPCSLAYNLVNAYGLNNQATRPVVNSLFDTIEYMPLLNLDTDAKSKKFVNFSSNFKPVEQ